MQSSLLVSLDQLFFYFYIEGKGKAPQLMVSRISKKRRVNESGFRLPLNMEQERARNQARRIKEFEILMAE
jgi:hypothetical protein